MGCDIHTHIELRVRGKWEHYAVPRVHRWYQLFGVMAGVRGDGPAIVEPKGVPDDMSVVTRLDWERWGLDAHTASWFNEEEIDKLSEWLSEQEKKDRATGKQLPCLGYDLEAEILNTYMFGYSLTAFKHYHDYKYLPDGCDAVRLVFWFDN